MSGTNEAVRYNGRHRQRPVQVVHMLLRTLYNCTHPFADDAKSFCCDGCLEELWKDLIPIMTAPSGDQKRGNSQLALIQQLLGTFRQNYRTSLFRTVVVNGATVQRWFAAAAKAHRKLAANPDGVATFPDIDLRALKLTVREISDIDRQYVAVALPAPLAALRLFVERCNPPLRADGSSIWLIVAPTHPPGSEKEAEQHRLLNWYKGAADMLQLRNFMHVPVEECTADAVKAAVKERLEKKDMRRALQEAYSRCFLHVVGHGVQGKWEDAGGHSFAQIQEALHGALSETCAEISPELFARKLEQRDIVMMLSCSSSDQGLLGQGRSSRIKESAADVGWLLGAYPVVTYNSCLLSFEQAGLADQISILHICGDAGDQWDVEGWMRQLAPAGPERLHIRWYQELEGPAVPGGSDGGSAAVGSGGGLIDTAGTTGATSMAANAAGTSTTAGKSRADAAYSDLEGRVGKLCKRYHETYVLRCAPNPNTEFKPKRAAKPKCAAATDKKQRIGD